MFSWFVAILSFLTGACVQYSRQTRKVATANYPVTKSPATVSIIIPAFNEETFIEDTLLSLQNQNIIQEYPEMFEIIVVDNGSTDSTSIIASQYAKVVFEPNRGKLNAKHKGVEEATGEIIVFLDADVTYGPNFLNLLLRHFHESEVVAVSGCFLTGDVIRDIFAVQFNSWNSTLSSIFNGAASAMWKETYYAVGGHRLDIDQLDRNAVQDEEERAFLQRLKQVGKVVVDAEATVFVPNRFQECLMHLDGAYCAEVREGKRF